MCIFYFVPHLINNIFTQSTLFTNVVILSLVATKLQGNICIHHVFSFIIPLYTEHILGGTSFWKGKKDFFCHCYCGGRGRNKKKIEEQTIAPTIVGRRQHHRDINNHIVSIQGDEPSSKRIHFLEDFMHHRTYIKEGEI